MWVLYIVAPKLSMATGRAYGDAAVAADPAALSTDPTKQNVDECLA